MWRGWLCSGRICSVCLSSVVLLSFSLNVFPVLCSHLNCPLLWEVKMFWMRIQVAGCSCLRRRVYRDSDFIFSYWCFPGCIVFSLGFHAMWVWVKRELRMGFKLWSDRNENCALRHWILGLGLHVQRAVWCFLWRFSLHSTIIHTFFSEVQQSSSSQTWAKIVKQHLSSMPLTWPLFLKLAFLLAISHWQLSMLIYSRTLQAHLCFSRILSSFYWFNWDDLKVLYVVTQIQLTVPPSFQCYYL